MRYFLFIVIILIAAQTGFAQNFQISHYTLSDGLPEKNLYDCLQDQKGIMWFASRKGVFKYDGTEFVMEGKKDSFITGDYFQLLETSEGEIWALPHFNDKPVQWNNGSHWQSLPLIDGVEAKVQLTGIQVQGRNNERKVFVNVLSRDIYVYENSLWRKLIGDTGGLGSSIKDIRFIDDTLFYCGTQGFQWYHEGERGSIDLGLPQDEKEGNSILCGYKRR